MNTQYENIKDSLKINKAFEESETEEESNKIYKQLNPNANNTLREQIVTLELKRKQSLMPSTASPNKFKLRMAKGRSSVQPTTNPSIFLRKRKSREKSHSLLNGYQNNMLKSQFLKEKEGLTIS
jgi:hypothetical protein